MRSRRTSTPQRLVGSLLAVGALIAGALTFATPAQAATVGVVNFNNSSFSPISFTGVVTDNFRIDRSVGGSPPYYLVNGTGFANNNTASGTSCIATASNVSACTIGVGSSFWYLAGLGTFNVTDGTNILGTITVTAPSGGGDAPPPLIQQFGKPVSGTCDAAAPSTLNWAGVVSGGWGDSWAQWMNGGRGGAVCTRMLVYSTAQSRWVIG